MKQQKNSVIQKSVPKKHNTNISRYPQETIRDLQQFGRYKLPGTSHNIQQFRQKLDVSKPALRFWGKEFEGILGPLRTNSGQRRYAEEHVSIIEGDKNAEKGGVEPARKQEKTDKQDGI